MLEYNGLTLDEKTGLVNGRIQLNPKETAMLKLMLSHPNRPISRLEFMEKVWETRWMADTRTLDVHICWLRQKIGFDRIKTVKKLGYQIQ